MSGDGLKSAIESVREWTEARRDAEQESETRTALVVSCSMGSCNPPGPLWPADATWNVVSVQNLGNQTRERYEEELVLDSDIEHFRSHHDITAVLIVGHTGCEVLEDAYEQWATADSESPAGIKARLDPLRSLVGEAFTEEIVTASMPLRTVQHRLVEYNVRRQTGVLRRALPPSVTVAGYVHDQDGAYSSFPGKQYLVAVDDTADPATIRARIPDETAVGVGSLLA